MRLQAITKLEALDDDRPFEFLTYAPNTYIKIFPPGANEDILLDIFRDRAGTDCLRVAKGFYTEWKPEALALIKDPILWEEFLDQSYNEFFELTPHIS